MHAAIFGSGTWGVDYYMKKTAWHRDGYKDMYQQVYNPEKPYIHIQNLEGSKFARVLRICLDASTAISDQDIQRLLLQIGAHELPDLGMAEVVSFHGDSSLNPTALYDKTFILETAVKS